MKSLPCLISNQNETTVLFIGILLFSTYVWFIPMQGDQKFRPMGDCLLWAVFLKIAKITYIFGYFFRRLRLCINNDKNVWGYILGDFRSNSSGHPVYM
jgi:hypothetical protein